MPIPPTYDMRTRLVLRDIARESLNQITFDDLLRRVEEQIVEDGLQVGRRYRLRVRTAVTNIARSQRVRLQRNGDEMLVRMTAEGLQEFAAYGTTPIYIDGSPRLKRMPRDQASICLSRPLTNVPYADKHLQLKRETEVLEDIAKKIQQAFQEVKPGSPAVDDPTAVIDEVRNAIDHSRALGEQATALYTSMAENSKRERYLKGLLRESDAHTSGGDHAGPSSRAA